MSFNLEALEQQDSPVFDSRVGITVMSLLSNFFKKNDDIIIYVADCLDGRQEKRRIKFNRWFRDYPIDGVVVDEYIYNDIRAGIIRKTSEEHESISLEIRQQLNKHKEDI